VRARALGPEPERIARDAADPPGALQPEPARRAARLLVGDVGVAVGFEIARRGTDGAAGRRVARAQRGRVAIEALLATVDRRADASVAEPARAEARAQVRGGLRRGDQRGDAVGAGRAEPDGAGVGGTAGIAL